MAGKAVTPHDIPDLSRILARVRQALPGEETKSRRAFARRLGQPPSTYDGWERGDNQPPVDVLAQIAAAYPEVSREFLLTGRGPVLREGRSPRGSVD